ncbi:hypothetical protein CMI40_00705 [Candidatus Pacearchaeota archaeon]|nr:hypothetical protein [Candidatus Pacearchaeota archaeon]|tara:strand:+ start:9294 stop:10205 length:912 start_codon:yes stop_codon:yes gene_type:complete
MRIKLKKGKQKALINLAKINFTWKELSKRLNISEGYLRNELRNEERTLDNDKYKIICQINNVNFDKYIINQFEDNWGRSKGGIKSSKNIKIITIPKKDEKLAEVIGIILGDGHVSEFKIGKRIRCYMIRVAGNSETDKDYLTRYIPFIFYDIFNEKGSLHFSKTSKVGYFTIYGKKFVDYIKSIGIKSGNKKRNNQGIPLWIKNNKKYISKCIKGLIDTDGSIHYISKNNKNIRISYTSYIPQLLNDVRKGLINLGFNPSKIITEKQIFLSSKKDIEKYIGEIGFGNSKNLNRFNILKKRMPL